MSFVLVVLMFIVFEVKSNKVTVKIDEVSSSKNGTPKKRVFVMITHGTFDNKKLKTIYSIKSSEFTCLKENHSVVILTGNEKPEAFKVVVKQSFDFGKFEDYDSSVGITQTFENNIACFFNGYFSRDSDQEEEEDKVELYLNFLTKTAFDLPKILIFYSKK